MKRLWVISVFLPLHAAVIPDRYIVELSTEPVAEHVAHLGRRGLRSQAAAEHRARIQAEHRTARAALERQGATVVDHVETVANALVVRIPDAQAARLARVAGVRGVHPVRTFHMLLDHALPLHKVPDAWNMVGIDNAGAGMKIAIIDTGIDITHPAFQDSSLSVPDGFPKTNNDSDRAYTNGKVIVARSYASMFTRSDPDPSARDHVGHGTGTAMAAAGGQATGPLATISGVAPKAWLGSYKVFGSPGVNDGAPEDAILKAIDDAVADGMDVINLSLGSDVAGLPSDDPEVQALERAASLGVIVAVAAGNNGPDPATVGSPATAPSAIAVGAAANDRIFAASAIVDRGGSYAALPGSGPRPATELTAPLADVAALDGNGLACAPLPADSLRGRIAFILRGTCTFETKLNSVQAAGAVAALVYSDEARPNAISMAVGSATLPAEMIGYQSGIEIKQRLSAGLTVTLRFTLGPVYTAPDYLADFSSKGPNLDGTIKPDLVAVGMNFYTAAEKTDRAGALYDPNGFLMVDGTSFSSPLVAGAAAVLKAARPGLTAAQYRSLLVNSAARLCCTTQQDGAGSLDLSAALRSTAALAPVSLSFGAGGADASVTRHLVISNVGTAAETFLISAVASAGSPAPAFSADSVQLDPGASADLTVTFAAAGLAAGQYEGFVSVQGTSSGVEMRAPYWYAVPSGAPRYITVLDETSSGRAGAVVNDAVLFRVTDASGLAVAGITPDASVVSGDGTVVSVRLREGISPGMFGLNVRLGARGTNVFRIQAGDVTRDVILSAR